jgi:hypothetical protein
VLPAVAATARAHAAEFAVDVTSIGKPVVNHAVSALRLAVAVATPTQERYRLFPASRIRRSRNRAVATAPSMRKAAL